MRFLFGLKPLRDKQGNANKPSTLAAEIFNTKGNPDSVDAWEVWQKPT
ncbi:MAG: hypothetical protein GY816_22370 [Cytophagales bacterium]|nr:hypothetical protein [Cytophagales bacterium]